MADISTEQITEIAQRVKSLLSAESLGVGEIPVVNNLAGIRSLPALQRTDEIEKVVEAPLTLLIGETGATPELTFKVNALPYGSKPTVNTAGTAGAPTITIGFPLAKNGDELQVRKGTAGIEVKYETEEESEWRVLWTYRDVMPDVSDFSPEGIAILQKPAQDAADAVLETMVQIFKDTSLVIKGAEDATNAAQNVADHPTYVGTDNYVYKWDFAAQQYKKTNIYVKGDGLDYNTMTPEEIAGITGKSAYEVATDNGFKGTEAEWLASLKGEKGEPTVYDDSTIRKEITDNLVTAKKYTDDQIVAFEYELPEATPEVLGGIKTGYQSEGDNFAVQLDENNKAFVNVPKTGANELLVIELATNQSGTSDPILISVKVHVKYQDHNVELTYIGEPITVEIPMSIVYTIEYEDVAGYKTPEAETHLSLASLQRNVTGMYKAELVAVVLTTDSGDSAVGQKVTINGVEYIYNEPVNVPVPFGVEYSVSVDNKPGFIKPDNQSFTANQKNRSVAFTYSKIVRGIFILDISGELIVRDAWNVSNNDKAVGVAVVSENCEFVIAKENPTVRHIFGSSTLIETIVTTTDMAIAVQNYAGIFNTAQIIAKLGESNPKAVAYCRSVQFLHGGQGYLGSLGEWKEVLNNESEVDLCMSLIGGEAIIPNESYWTSTQYDASKMWRISFGNKIISEIAKSNSIRARAFAPITP